MEKINKINIGFSALSLVALLLIIFFAPTNCEGGLGILGCGLTLRLLLSALICLNTIAQIIFSLWRLYTEPSKDRATGIALFLHCLLLALILIFAWIWFSGGLAFVYQYQ